MTLVPRPAKAAFLYGLFLWMGFCRGCDGLAADAAPAVSLADEKSRLPAPTRLQAIQQDAHAIRLTWKPLGNHIGAVLYASYNQKPFHFHRENEVPIHENFLIWDAPRDGIPSFAFYVTATDDSGHESAPSSTVTYTLKKR